MYQYYIDPITKENYLKGIKRTTDNAFIPFDPANTDYQAYLKWVDEGGITEPANE
jgi:hypothetical protein